MLPNKLFEFLMAGVPVLTSSLEDVVDIIRSYDVGQVVSSLAPADIGTAINAMLTDQHALDRMRYNALKAAQEDLNWEKEQRQLVRLYHKILARDRRTTSLRTPSSPLPYEPAIFVRSSTTVSHVPLA